MRGGRCHPVGRLSTSPPTVLLIEVSETGVTSSWATWALVSGPTHRDIEVA